MALNSILWSPVARITNWNDGNTFRFYANTGELYKKKIKWSDCENKYGEFLWSGMLIIPKIYFELFEALPLPPKSILIQK